MSDLTDILTKVKAASSKYGLHLNVKKTKLMTTTGLKSFELDGEEIEVVNNFVFLGACVKEGGT